MRDLTLSDFPFVASLAESADPNDRRIWLRVACDHFVIADQVGPEAVERFADAILRQIEIAGLATALSVAQTLSPCPRTPVRLLQAFVRLSPETCDVVLEAGAAFSPADLLGAIEAGVRQAKAVARRQDLDGRVVSRLAASDDAEVLATLAANPRARLEGPVLPELVKRARALAEGGGDRRLAEALVRRRPLRPECAALFLVADPLERVEILLAAQRAELGRPLRAPASVATEIVAELELQAVARRPERFVEVLATALACDSALAKRIADDPSGEPLAVALAALGAPGDVLVRVLIASDLETGGDAYRRIRALARLNNALDRNAAITVMAALRGQPGGRRRQGAPDPAQSTAREGSSRRAARATAAPPRKIAAV